MTTALGRLLEKATEKQKYIIMSNTYAKVLLDDYCAKYKSLQNSKPFLLEHEHKSINNASAKAFIEYLFDSLNNLNNDTHYAVERLKAFAEEQRLSDELVDQLRHNLERIAQQVLITFKDYQDAKDFRDYRLEWIEHSCRLRFISTGSNC